jgi:hypothetical protein
MAIDPYLWTTYPGSTTYATANQYTVTTGTTLYPNTNSPMIFNEPATIVVNPPPVEPVDDSPLAWLRRQVDEVCELAWAA